MGDKIIFENGGDPGILLKRNPDAVPAIPMPTIPEGLYPAVPMPHQEGGHEIPEDLKRALPNLFGLPYEKELIDPKLIPIPQKDKLLHDATEYSECLIKGDVLATLMERAGDTFTGYNPLQTSRAADAFRDHAVDACINELSGPTRDIPLIPDFYDNGKGVIR